MPDTHAAWYQTMTSEVIDCAREVLKHTGGASFHYNSGICTVYTDLTGTYDAHGALYSYRY